MPDDRTLLERAARAAGMRLRLDILRDQSQEWGGWNPLEDDGDEARLEAALGLDVFWQPDCVHVGQCLRDDIAIEYFANHNGDKQAARRRAGVRAAAEKDARAAAAMAGEE